MGKAKDSYFTMGTPELDIAGFSTSYNIAKPSVKHFRRYLKINKELSDFSLYSVTGPAGLGTVVTNS